MKILRTDNPASGEMIVTVIFTEGDLGHHLPSKMEVEASKIANKTEKISDQLFYLSELADGIEMEEQK